MTPEGCSSRRAATKPEVAICIVFVKKPIFSTSVQIDKMPNRLVVELRGSNETGAGSRLQGQGVRAHVARGLQRLELERRM